LNDYTKRVGTDYNRGPEMSSKTNKAKLAKGAKKIRKAEKEARKATATKPELKNGKGNKAKQVAAPIPVEPVVIPESTKPIQDILDKRVKIFPGHTGLKLADDTPIEETLRILDWTTQMSDHVGFMIGDVINFGEAQWGEKYTAALNQTGRDRKST